MPQKNSQPSIETTETHHRQHKITLDTHQIRSILIDEGLRLANLQKTLGVTVDLYIDSGDRCPTTGEHRPTATITITEDLSTPSDEAPTDPHAFRLSKPATGLTTRYIDDLEAEVMRMLDVAGPCTGPTNITSPPGLGQFGLGGGALTLNASAIGGVGSMGVPPQMPQDLRVEDLMKKVNKIYEVLLHGKGHNITLSTGEVNTLLEYIDGAQGRKL